MTKSARRPVFVLALIGGGAVLAVALVVLVGYQFTRSGFHKGPDHHFGDQHLKTTVALVELHHVRHGKYPASLSELEYLGGWDPLHVNSVRYCPNADRSAYYVEVTRGWIGKPTLSMPPEFWRGTGYREELAADCP